MRLTFVKMHGLGNDFIVLADHPGPDRKAVRRLCRRRFGIGADGLLNVSRLDGNRIRMHYWNADGSRAEICGNGLRCAVKYALGRGWIKGGEIKVETDAGEQLAYWDGRSEMIETRLGRVVYAGETVSLDGFDFHIANIGNPHAIAFLPSDAAWPDLADLGPRVENHERFPRKTNVEWARPLSSKAMEMVFWERGVGETPACATGMVSAAAVACELGKISLPVKISVAGGTAEAWLDKDGFSRLLAPAVLVCSGQTDIEPID